MGISNLHFSLFDAKQRAQKLTMAWHGRYLSYYSANEGDEWRFGELLSSSIDSTYNEPHRTTLVRLTWLKTGLESDQLERFFGSID